MTEELGYCEVGTIVQEFVCIQNAKTAFKIAGFWHEFEPKLCGFETQLLVRQQRCSCKTSKFGKVYFLPNTELRERLPSRLCNLTSGIKWHY